jgi:hypothetical protein
MARARVKPTEVEGFKHGFGTRLPRLLRKPIGSGDVSFRRGPMVSLAVVCLNN